MALFDRQTVKLEKGKLVPIAALKGGQAFTEGEEAPTAKSVRIAPFERDDITGLMDGFQNTSHLSIREFPLKHALDRRPPRNGDLSWY